MLLPQLFLFLCALAAGAPHRAAASDDPPSVGQSIVIGEIRVTLLDARRLSREEFRDASGEPSALWQGGGLRVAFLVEHHVGEPTPPVLGEVRVLFGSQLYNAVTNATSRKPFSPDVIIRAVDDFYLTGYGKTVRRCEARPGTTAVVLDLLIRGGPIQLGSAGVVELEQGETHPPPPDRDGRLQPLHAGDVVYRWFRFRLPLLD